MHLSKIESFLIDFTIFFCFRHLITEALCVAEQFYFSFQPWAPVTISIISGYCFIHAILHAFVR